MKFKIKHDVLAGKKRVRGSTKLYNSRSSSKVGIRGNMHTNRHIRRVPTQSVTYPCAAQPTELLLYIVFFV